ncbi:MAG: hypothetical protein HY519_04395 [Candidatus Aenigmarchaeota archaeon]|nr:hypothetical protein [Candidatus Aenigmarchaeota archaeon]
MTDWRIVGASAVAVVVISGIFATTLGVSDGISGLLEKVGGFVGKQSSGLFSQPGKHAITIDVRAYADSAEFKPLSHINATFDTGTFANFNGILKADMVARKVVFKDAAGAESAFNLGTVAIDSIRVASINLDRAKFIIDGQVRADNGNLSLKDFSGKLTITRDGFQFAGTVSSLKASFDNKTWNLS